MPFQLVSKVKAVWPEFIVTAIGEDVEAFLVD